MGVDVVDGWTDRQKDREVEIDSVWVVLCVC